MSKIDLFADSVLKLKSCKESTYAVFCRLNQSVLNLYWLFPELFQSGDSKVHGRMWVPGLAVAGYIAAGAAGYVGADFLENLYQKAKS